MAKDNDKTIAFGKPAIILPDLDELKKNWDKYQKKAEKKETKQPPKNK